MKKTKLVMVIVLGLLFIVGTSIVAILLLSKGREGNKEILYVFEEASKGVIEISEENDKESAVTQEELKIDYLTIDDNYTSEELKQMYESKALVEGTIYKAKCDMNNDDIIDIVEVIVKNEVKYVPERSDAYGIQGYDGGIDNCIVKINNIERNLKAINPIKEIEIINENGTKKLKIYTSYRDYARNYYITYSNELNVEIEEMGNTISVGSALFEYTTRGSEAIITRIVGNEKITSNADMFEYDYDKPILIIPEKIGDYEVVGIKKGAFDKCKSEYVIIPDSVSGIESGVIPSSIKRISQDDKSIVKKGDSFEERMQAYYNITRDDGLKKAFGNVRLNKQDEHYILKADLIGDVRVSKVQVNEAVKKIKNNKLERVEVTSYGGEKLTIYGKRPEQVKQNVIDASIRMREDGFPEYYVGIPTFDVLDWVNGKTLDEWCSSDSDLEWLNKEGIPMYIFYENRNDWIALKQEGEDYLVICRGTATLSEWCYQGVNEKDALTLVLMPKDKISLEVADYYTREKVESIEPKIITVEKYYNCCTENNGLFKDDIGEYNINDMVSDDVEWCGINGLEVKDDMLHIMYGYVGV